MFAPGQKYCSIEKDFLTFDISTAKLPGGLYLFFSLMALEKVAAIDTFFNPKQKGCYYANMFHLTDHPITNILVKT